MGYFPNIPESTWREIHDLMEQTKSLSQATAIDYFETRSKIDPHLAATSFTEAQNFILAQQLGQTLVFPNPIPRIKLPHIVSGYSELIFRKYNLPGFVEVARDDVVIDVGAFVGGFSINASASARNVFSFEPETNNFNCLLINTSLRQNIHPIKSALGAITGPQLLNLSSSAVEHSFLEPDEGCTGKQEAVSMYRLDDFAAEHHVAKVDFLKLEAEGYELEVFEGLGDIRPIKIAIDVSPERNGESPAEAFRKKLEGNYDVEQRGNVLFARIKRII